MSDKKSTERKRQFNGSSTCEQVLKGIDLTGEIIAVTGTTNGIGIETARSLALAGAHVICLNRNEKLTEEAIEKVRNDFQPTVEMSFIKCDLSSLASVKAAAEQLIQKHEKLDVLILNAGIYSPAEATVDGLEAMFGINHVGHFHLTMNLLPLLEKSTPSRIVVVSSEAHTFTGINPTTSLEEKVGALMPAVEKDVGIKRGFTLYSLSKLCNVLFAMKLHRMLEGKAVDVYVLHPGAILSTNLGYSMGFMGRVIKFFASPFGKSLNQGASTTVLCAAHPETQGISGKYWDNCWDDEKNLKRVFSDDIELQDELWRRTEKIIEGIEKRGV